MLDNAKPIRELQLSSGHAGAQKLVTMHVLGPDSHCHNDDHTLPPSPTSSSHMMHGPQYFHNPFRERSPNICPVLRVERNTIDDRLCDCSVLCRDAPCRTLPTSSDTHKYMLSSLEHGCTASSFPIPTQTGDLPQ